MEVDLDALEAETKCPVCLGEASKLLSTAYVIKALILAPAA